MKYICSLILSCFFFGLTAQVSINADGSSADPSAILEVKSTTGGLMIPSMTQAQRTAIASPAEGLTVYQTNAGSTGRGFYIRKGGIWTSFRGDNYYTGSVTLGTPDVLDGDPGVGIIQMGLIGDVVITHPALGGSGTLPSVLLTPVYDQVDSDLPYCPVDFIGSNCTLRDHYIWFSLVNITSTNVHIRHTPPNTECTGTANNYEFKEYVNGIDPGDIYTNDSLCAGIDQFFFQIQGQSGASGCTSYDIFIDWNQDGDFQDTGELVGERLWGCDNGAWTPTPYTNPPPAVPQTIGPFTTPATAATGKTRLRVTARKFNSTNNGVDNSDEPCNNDATEGSSKDYDVFIKGGSTPAGISSQNVCDVITQTTTQVRVLCYGIDASPKNFKFHFKILEN